MSIRAESPEHFVTYARLDYLFRLGVFVVSVAVVATTILRGIAGLFDLVPVGFTPLLWSQVIGATVIGSAGGVFVYAVLDRFTTYTTRNFVLVAAVVLALSTAPLWLAEHMDGATTASIFILAIMHLVVAVITVGLLLRMDRERGLTVQAIETEF